jgi:hypothetical protein
MPNNVDLSKVIDKIHALETAPNGWVNTLTIEYVVMPISEMVNWRVKGTQHTFTIPLMRLHYLSEGNYAKHFEEVLYSFRQQYKDWETEGFKYEWTREYRDQFKNYIT